MQNVSNQSQEPQESESERGYAAQQPPEYQGYAAQQPPEYQGGFGPQSGYAQQPPEYQGGFGPQSGPQSGYAQQPYPPYYQGQQQQYWNQRGYGMSAPGDVSPFERTSMGMKATTAGLLSYLFGWVGGLVFFLLERNNRFVRFHAAQSILFFGAISILGWVFSLFPYGLFGLGGVVGLVGFIGWIVLMIAAHRGRYYKLPLFGDLAEQLANRATF